MKEIVLMNIRLQVSGKNVLIFLKRESSTTSRLKIEKSVLIALASSMIHEQSTFIYSIFTGNNVYFERIYFIDSSLHRERERERERGFIKKFLNIYSMFYEHVITNVVYKVVPLISRVINIQI